jgi:hypothetical protein
MLRAITLVICSYSTLLAAFALAGPTIPPVQRFPPGQTGTANVALFNLPAAVTPPAPAVLELVYQGFGIYTILNLVLPI